MVVIGSLVSSANHRGRLANHFRMIAVWWPTRSPACTTGFHRLPSSACLTRYHPLMDNHGSPNYGQAHSASAILLAMIGRVQEAVGWKGHSSDTVLLSMSCDENFTATLAVAKTRRKSDRRKTCKSLNFELLQYMLQSAGPIYASFGIRREDQRTYAILNV